MTILFERELISNFEQRLSSASKSVLVLSAFVKIVALENLLKFHKKKKLDITIVARWKLQDLLTNASDLSVYEFAQNNGWKFAINTNMHYKIYLIDDASLFIGSANLTQKGLHIGINGNDEASVEITPTSIDIAKLRQYANNCTVIDDILYSEMKKVVDSHKKDFKQTVAKWPSSIKQHLTVNIKHLWLNDLFFNSPTRLKDQASDCGEHDFLLLGLAREEELHDKKFLLERIRTTLFWKWVIKIVSDSDREFVHFGEISAKLHNALLDDPKPSRKDVKYFLSNFYDWIKYLKPPEIGVKKFNVTEALFLK